MKIKEMADTLGIEYMRLKEKQGAVALEVEKTTKTIKILADEKGEERGKNIIVEGDEYTVGYTLREPTPEIDFKKMFLILPHMRKMLCSFQPDMAKVEKAVKEGKLKRSTLRKFMVPSKKEPTKAVYVRKTTEEKELD
jgi:hypothetical protein